MLGDVEPLNKRPDRVEPVNRIEHIRLLHMPRHNLVPRQEHVIPKESTYHAHVILRHIQKSLRKDNRFCIRGNYSICDDSSEQSRTVSSHDVDSQDFKVRVSHPFSKYIGLYVLNHSKSNMFLRICMHVIIQSPRVWKSI